MGQRLVAGVVFTGLLAACGGVAIAAPPAQAPAVGTEAVAWGATALGLALVGLLVGYGGYVMRVLTARRAGGHLQVTGPDGETLGRVGVPGRPEVIVGAAQSGGADVRLPWLPGEEALFRIRVEVETTGGPWRAGLAAWRRRPVAVAWAEAVWPYHLYSPHSGPLPRRRVDLDDSAPFSAGGLTFLYCGAAADGRTEAAPVADLLGALGSVDTFAGVQVGAWSEAGDLSELSEGAPPALFPREGGGREAPSLAQAVTSSLRLACEWTGRVLAPVAVRTGRRLRECLAAGAARARGLLGSAGLWTRQAVPVAGRWAGGIPLRLLQAGGRLVGLGLLSLAAWLLAVSVRAGRACLRALGAAVLWALGGVVRGLGAAGRWVVRDLQQALEFGEEAGEAGEAFSLPLGGRPPWAPGGTTRASGTDLLGFLHSGEHR